MITVAWVEDRGERRVAVDVPGGPYFTLTPAQARNVALALVAFVREHFGRP